MNDQQIMAYLALYAAARAIGEELYSGVREIVGARLSKEDLAAVEARWDANAQRAAVNAGIVPEA